MSATNTKVALVTGGNKGIGKELVRGLAKLGFVVYLGSRDESRGREAAKELSADGKVEFVQLDVSDQASIDRAVKSLEAKHGHLDVLINNAGVSVGGGKPISQQTVATFRENYDVNVFGTVANTNAFLPLLRRAPAARIVNVTSGLGSIGGPAIRYYPDFAAYSSSKAALNSVTVHYAVELKDTPIKVNMYHPGVVETDMSKGFPAEKITPAEAAVTGLKLATLPADGPSGEFRDENYNVLPW